VISLQSTCGLEGLWETNQLHNIKFPLGDLILALLRILLQERVNSTLCVHLQLLAWGDSLFMSMIKLFLRILRCFIHTLVSLYRRKDVWMQLNLFTMLTAEYFGSWFNLLEILVCVLHFVSL